MPGADAPTPGPPPRRSRPPGSIAYWQGRTQDCQRLYEEERDLAARLDDPVMAADASFNLAAAYVINGDLERGASNLADARRRFEAIGRCSRRSTGSTGGRPTCSRSPVGRRLPGPASRLASNGRSSSTTPSTWR